MNNIFGRANDALGYVNDNGESGQLAAYDERGQYLGYANVYGTFNYHGEQISVASNVAFLFHERRTP